MYSGKIAVPPGGGEIVNFVTTETKTEHLEIIVIFRIY
jgi:hypothetical protein